MLPEYFDFHVRTRVIAGPGLSSQFGNELTRFKVSRAFIVTDKVVGRLGFLERIRESLSGGGLEVAGVFDDVPPNSEFGVVTRGPRPTGRPAPTSSWPSAGAVSLTRPRG